MQEAERMFARAAATNPGSPYVFLAWGQMRGVACADVAGARAVFNRGAELCPRCAAFAAPICSSTPPPPRLCSGRRLCAWRTAQAWQWILQCTIS